MARIRFSGGIVPAEDRRVWLVDDPGHEVDESRPYPGAAVVVGPPGATTRQVDRARREARRLVTAGGNVVAAANVNLGHGFETARVEGGGETRREAVLAAVELLGIDEIDRIGPRQAVLVALFGTRATKRVGAAALAALAAHEGDGGRRSAVRLAVAASDLLVPEQLEAVLRLDAPAAIEPVPRGTTALLADQLAAVLGPLSAKRRAGLVHSVWADVVGWQHTDAARARARRRRVSAAQKEAARATVRRHDDAWWRARFAEVVGEDHPSAGRMLSWVPPDYVWRAALRRAFQEAVAATVLVRTALAAEGQSVEEAVLANLGPLAYAATAHASGLHDRIESLHRSKPPGQPAADRAWALASAVVLASDPRDLGSHDIRLHLRAQLRRACELGMAVLDSTVDLLNGGGGLPDPGDEPAVREWRGLVGYTGERDPHDWWGGEVEELVLARRLEDGGDPADVERIEDLLWLADLADALAAWFGWARAGVGFGRHLYADVDPPAPPPDPRLPSLESVPLAVAGAAQLVALGAATVPRPTSWSALVDGLVAGSERLGLDGRLTLPADVADWDGRELPGHELRIEVGRTAQQLAEWGNYMANCIASYAEDAGRRFALLALRDSSGTIRANVSVALRAERWSVDQALARFNAPLPDELDEALRTWAHEIRVPATPVRPPQPPGPTRTRHGPGHRGPARARLREAAARVGDRVEDLSLDRADAARGAILPIARELGWAADEAGDYEGPFVAVARPRRSGPLAEATARVLEGGTSLAMLWRATAGRPLSAAVDFALVGDQAVDLRRLTELTVPPSLRIALTEPRVWRARVVELACRRVRAALADLVLAGDARLDAAVAAAPEPGFLATTVLLLTASAPAGLRVPVDEIPVGPDGAVPGRPPTSVRDESGVWPVARRDAAELGAPGDRVEEIQHLLVPAAWTAGRGWPVLWARAHREARRLAAPVAAG